MKGRKPKPVEHHRTEGQFRPHPHERTSWLERVVPRQAGRFDDARQRISPHPVGDAAQPRARRRLSTPVAPTLLQRRRHPQGAPTRPLAIGEETFQVLALGATVSRAIGT